MKKAIIFDFDYTLGDSTEGIVQSTDAALIRLGEEKRTREEIKKTVGISLHETYKVLSGKDDDEKAELFTKYFIEKANEVMVDCTFLYDKSLYVLEKLKEKGYKTGIVTTKLNSRIQSILKKFSATHLIDVIVGVENVENVKPHPEGLLLACKNLNLNINEVLYVGDSFIDALAAQNAGVDFIGVTTGTTDKEKFSEYKNKTVCKNIEEVYDFVINNREEI